MRIGTDRRRGWWAPIVALTLALPGAIADEPRPEAGWVPLFNGKDLEGWTPKITGYPAGENYADTFRVEGGLLKVAYDKYPDFGGRFGHLFAKGVYKNYRLRVSYRFVGDQCPGGPGWAVRNSGAMICGQSPESMRVDQEFPVSVEVQFLGGVGKGRRSTCNVCSPGTNIVMAGKLVTQHCNDSSSATYDGDGWVDAEIVVKGGTITHLVDGKEVLRYESPQLDPTDADAKAMIEARGGDRMLPGGTISLQAESHPVHFRRVEIMPLPDDAK